MIFAHTTMNPATSRCRGKILVTGYVPEYLYEQRRLDQSIPFAELMRRSHINAVAQKADKGLRLLAPDPGGPALNVISYRRYKTMPAHHPFNRWMLPVSLRSVCLPSSWFATVGAQTPPPNERLPRQSSCSSCRILLPAATTAKTLTLTGVGPPSSFPIAPSE